MTSTLRPFLSKLLRPFSPTHRERDRLVQSITNLLAEKPVFRVADFCGDFEVDPRSRLFYRLIVDGSYEPDLIRLVKQHIDPARDAIDVGANVGFFSCLLAKSLPGRRVLSIEPTLNALSSLRSNLKRNRVDEQVIVFEGVATNQRSVVSLAYVQGMEEFSSLDAINHPSVGKSAVQTMEVKGETLDSLVAELNLNPGFIKIDTEGAESLVLSGAKQVLSQFRPVVLSELSDPLLKAKGSSAAEVIELLKSLGYKVTDPLSPSSPAGSRPYGDILAIPLK